MSVKNLELNQLPLPTMELVQQMLDAAFINATPDLEVRYEAQKKTIMGYQQREQDLVNRLRKSQAEVAELEERLGNQRDTIGKYQQFEADVREIFDIDLIHATEHDKIVTIVNFLWDYEKSRNDCLLHSIAHLLGMEVHPETKKHELLQAIHRDLVTLVKINEIFANAYEEVAQAVFDE